MTDARRGVPRRIRPVRAVALGAAFALLVAACGSGRSDSTSSTTAPGGSTPGGSTPTASTVIDSSQCDPSTLTQGISGNTIKLGTSLPLSGTYSAFNAILMGEQAYISYLNAQGGVTVAGKKYKIQLVSKDDAYDAAKTSTNVSTLINSDKVFALFNTVGTKNNLGIRETVNSDCVPDLAIASGAVQWGNTKYPWMLGSELVPYPLEMQVFVDYLKTNKPNAKIALLYANDDFGQSYKDTLEQLVKGTTLSIVKQQSYNAEGSEVKAQVTDLAASKADTFVLGGTLLACPNALSAAHDAGWKPLIYMSGTCVSKLLFTLGGDGADGVLSVTPLMDPADPANAANAAVKLYKAADREVPAQGRRQRRHRGLRLVDRGAVAEDPGSVTEARSRLGHGDGPHPEGRDRRRLATAGLDVDDEPDRLVPRRDVPARQVQQGRGSHRGGRAGHEPRRQDRGPVADVAAEQLTVSAPAVRSRVTRASMSVTTSRPSRVRSQAALRACRSDSPS